MAYPKHDRDAGRPGEPDLPAVERRVLDHWAADKTFEATVERATGRRRTASNEFVFYDGPPFANGLPHYGHLLTGYVKDVVPRYQTMRGHRVERRFGWDCHGLPAEVEAEKQLGITTKAEILALGVDKFNDACRTSVLRYTQDWERYVTRQARWVDFANDYKTLDLPYMESVMWAFKTLHDKGLVYEGFRVLAYCWRCETPLSNTETRMDDVYRDRQDPALTVAFQLETGEKLAGLDHHAVDAAVEPGARGRPRHRVRRVRARTAQTYVLGAARARRVRQGAGEATRRSARVHGRDLVGRRYTPLFDFLVEQAGPNAFQVLGGDFVTTEDGTGVVHMAPAFGEDDQTACNAAGIPTVVTVDDHTRFTALVPPYEGMQVFEANKPVIARPQGPRRRGAPRHLHPLVPALLAVRHAAGLQGGVELVRRGDQVQGPDGRAEPADHLDARARQGRLVRQVAGQRPRLVDQPQPVLGLADPGVEVRRPALPAGRRLRLARRARARLRRAPSPTCTGPTIDDLTRPNPDDPTGQSTMRRVPEVLDCWFESGSMPFAQVHYPFENADWFEHHYPGDFIVEYIGQTRGWFYTHARAGHGAVRPAGVPHLRRARHPARRRRPQDVQEPAATTRTSTRCSTRTAPTRCAGS